MEAFRAGQIPLWNPYLFSGVPFLANIQAAVLYPAALAAQLARRRAGARLVGAAARLAGRRSSPTCWPPARCGSAGLPAFAGGPDLRPRRLHAGPRREHQPTQRAGVAARRCCGCTMRHEPAGIAERRWRGDMVVRRADRRHRAPTAGRPHADDLHQHGRARDCGRVLSRGLAAAPRRACSACFRCWP